MVTSARLGWRAGPLTLIDAAAELVEHLQDQDDLTVSPGIVPRLLGRHGLSLKNTAHAAAPQQAGGWQRRLARVEAQPDPEPERLDQDGQTPRPGTRTRPPRRCQTDIGRRPPAPAPAAG